MATKKETRPIIIKEEHIVTPWDKKEKEGGRVYQIALPYKPAGQTLLGVGTYLYECNDGYYKVVNENQVEMHYRLGQVIVDNIT